MPFPPSPPAAPSKRWRGRGRRALTLACLIVGAPTPAAAQSAPAQHVTLQLKWLHQFQFAGYYAALAQGYYRDAGLDVHIEELRGVRDSTQPVLEGRAEFGVGSAQVVTQIARGAPLVLLAAIFQHSPHVILGRPASGVHTVEDLAGKRWAVEPESADLVAYLQRSGVDPSRLTQSPLNYSLEPFLGGSADAISAYRTDEPFELRARGMPYVLLDPQSAGIDFYGDMLFTSERELAAHPDRVRAFRAASLRGWQWALAHTEETVQLIWSSYSRRHTLDHLRFEAAETRRLVQPDFVDVGYISPGRIAHIAAVYRETGLLDRVPTDLARHVYDPEPRGESARLLGALAGLTALLVAALLAVARYWSLVRRLREAEATRGALVARLEDLARTDALTGLMNRRAGEERAEAEVARSMRHGAPLTLLMVDVDHFKRVNDSCGHLVGDEVLQAVARALLCTARSTDVVARMGGEEFMVLAPHTTEEGASVLAERVRGAVEAMPMQCSGAARTITVSVGVGVWCCETTTLRELWRRADAALYAAKREGRNRVACWTPAADRPSLPEAAPRS